MVRWKHTLKAFWSQFPTPLVQSWDGRMEFNSCNIETGGGHVIGDQFSATLWLVPSVLNKIVADRTQARIIENEEFGLLTLLLIRFMKHTEHERGIKILKLFSPSLPNTEVHTYPGGQKVAQDLEE